jgi:hypothetical protein
MNYTIAKRLKLFIGMAVLYSDDDDDDDDNDDNNNNNNKDNVCYKYHTYV